MWPLVSVAVALVAVQAQVLPVRVNVGSAPQQTFKGFGFSMVRGGNIGGHGFHGPLGNFTKDVRESILKLLCEDLGVNVVRLWWTPADGAPQRPGHLDGDSEFMNAYVNSGLISDFRRHGVTQLLLAPDLPCAQGAQNSSAGGHNVTLRAEQTVRFIQALKKRGVVIDVTGVANEPGCWAKWQNASGSYDANWPKVPDESGNFVTAVTVLAKGLKSVAIDNVQILGPEHSNADSHGLALVEACKSDHRCWSALGSIASHSYGMAANDQWANATAGKGYWVTEAGAWNTLNSPRPFPGNDGHWQGVALASRFLNDLNHMVDTWVSHRLRFSLHTYNTLPVVALFICSVYSHYLPPHPPPIHTLPDSLLLSRSPAGS
jgi:O-glycosyl hydrolase